MMRLASSVLVIALLFPADTAAQQLTPGQVSGVRRGLQRGDTSPIVLAFANQCEGDLETSRADTTKVSERARLAREALLCARGVGAAVVVAAPPQQALQARAVADALTAPYVQNAEDASNQQAFLGLTWGVGVGISVSRKHEAVSDAEIVDGIVRVRSQQREQPRVLLEYHKYLPFASDNTQARWGFGPFVAAAATTEDLLSGAGFGVMGGWRNQATSKEGFSVGAGLVLDANVKDLETGFVPDEPPPEGATSIRYTTKGRWSWIFFVTRTF